MQDQEYIDKVDAFLRAFETRDLDVVKDMMTENPIMVFPPGTTYRSLEELSSGLSKNYNWVNKNRDSYSVGTDAETGRVVVVSRGRLFGEDLEGKPFKDVPYIDFFVFEDGKVAEQHVWNHLAAQGIMKPVARS